VKLLDFGLAKVGIETPESKPELEHAETVTGVTTDAAKIMGTPGYMSPEQARGDPLDVRSDVFSFGTMLYEMLTGENPFARRTVGATFIAIATEPFPPLTEVGESTAALVARCLAKAPGQRFANAGELADALDVPAAAPPPPSPRTVDVAPSASTRRRGPLPVAVVAAVAIGLVALLWFARARPEVPIGESPAASASAAGPTTLVDLPPPTTANRDALNSFVAGRVALREEHGGSKTLFRRATELDPDFAAAYLYIALADVNGHQTSAYQEAFRRSDKLGPRDREVLLALEPVFMQEPSDRKAATERLVKLLEQRPTDAQLWLLRGQVSQYEAPDDAST